MIQLYFCLQLDTKKDATTNADALAVIPAPDEPIPKTKKIKKENSMDKGNFVDLLP